MPAAEKVLQTVAWKSNKVRLIDQTALPEKLVWDREGAIHAGGGRPTDAFAGFCGQLGTQMLFMPLPSGEVLNITAPCSVAQRFASVALSRLAA